MIDQEKLDWKYPHLARLKNYAIGGGYALLFMAVILAVLYFTLKPEDALEKPAVAVQETPVVPVAKQPIKSVRKDYLPTQTDKKPTINELETVQKPKPMVKPAEPLTQFDSDLANFESKIP